MLYTKQLNLNLDDLPFEGSYTLINEEFKDEFGNTVTHIAKQYEFINYYFMLILILFSFPLFLFSRVHC